MDLFSLLLLLLGFGPLAKAFPTDIKLHQDGGLEELFFSHSNILLTLVILICTVTGLLSCLCCQRRKLKHSGATRNGNIKSGSVNVPPSVTEFTIFPPAGATDAENSSLVEVKFEPLPDIRPRNRSSGTGTIQRPRPANFSTLINKGLSVDDWFEAPHNNFPRHQLQYLKEVGSGWFGQVVEGEAQGLLSSQKKTKVIVKILREDATPTDQMFFLHEVKPFRDLNHPNVMKLLGQCLETDPFLIILEYCTFKDLKTYLVQHRTESESLIQGNLLLQMACNVAAGLNYMHTHNFIHTDLAGRNCLVGADLSVKIGDYGSSIEKFKEDYYCAGDVAVPIRWCAPETLKCTETTIETKEVTREANIWSFGIVVWEILEFGQTPYPTLHDEDVIEKVIIENSLVPEKPFALCSHHNRIYEVMKLCWIIDPQLRSKMDKVNALLSHLYTHRDSESSDFEARWNQLQPRRNVRLTNLTDIHAGGDSRALQFDNDFANRTITSIKINDSETITSRELSPSPHPSLSLENDFRSVVKSSSISPSLQNLRGSFEDINEGQLGFHVADASLTNPASQEMTKRNAFQSGQLDSGNWDLSLQDREFLLPKDLNTNQILEGECLHSETGEESFFPSITTVSNEASQTQEPSITINSDNKISTDDEETWKEIVESSKKEPGQITQMIREKSQSVQDFLKLTVIDSDNSDSDASASSKQLTGEELASNSEGVLSSVNEEQSLVQGSNRSMGVAIEMPETDSFANGALVNCSQIDLKSKQNQKDESDSNAMHSVSDSPSAIILIQNENFLQQNLELDKKIIPISFCRDNLDSNAKTVSLDKPICSDIMEKTNFPNSNPPEIVVQDVSLTPCDSSSNSVQGIGDSKSELQYEIDKPALNFRFVLKDSSDTRQEKKSRHLPPFADKEDLDKEISLDSTLSKTFDHHHHMSKRLTSTPNDDSYNDSQYNTMENSSPDNTLFYSCKNEALKLEDFVDSASALNNKHFEQSFIAGFQSPAKTEDETGNLDVENLEKLTFSNDAIASCQDCNHTEAEVSPRVECECIHSLDVETGEGSLVCIVRNLPEIGEPDISKGNSADFKSSPQQESLSVTNASTSLDIVDEVSGRVNYHDSSLKVRENKNSKKLDYNLPKITNTEISNLVTVSDDSEKIDSLKNELDSQLLLSLQDSNILEKNDDYPKVPIESTPVVSIDSEIVQNANSDPKVDSGCSEDIPTTSSTSFVIKEPETNILATTLKEDVKESPVLHIISSSNITSVDKVSISPESNFIDKISVPGENISFQQNNELSLFQEVMSNPEDLEAKSSVNSIQNLQKDIETTSEKIKISSKTLYEDSNLPSTSGVFATIVAKETKLDESPTQPTEFQNTKSLFENSCLAYRFTDEESGEIVNSEEPSAVQSDFPVSILDNTSSNLALDLNKVENNIFTPQDLMKNVSKLEENTPITVSNEPITTSLIRNNDFDFLVSVENKSENENELMMPRRKREVDDFPANLNETSKEKGINKNEISNLCNESEFSQCEGLESQDNLENADQNTKIDKNTEFKKVNHVSGSSNVIEDDVGDIVRTNATTQLLNSVEFPLSVPDLSSETATLSPSSCIVNAESSNNEELETFLNIEQYHPNLSSNEETLMHSIDSQQESQPSVKPSNLNSSCVSIFPSIAVHTEDAEWVLPDSEDNDAPYVLLSTQSNFHFLDDEGEEEEEGSKDNGKDNPFLKQSVINNSQKKLDESYQYLEDNFFSDKFETDTVQNNLPFVECSNLTSIDEFETDVDKESQLTITTLPPKEELDNKDDAVLNMEEIKSATLIAIEKEDHNPISENSDDSLGENKTSINVYELLINNSCIEETTSLELPFDSSDIPLEILMAVKENEKESETHRSKTSVEFLTGGQPFTDISGVSRYATLDKTTGTSLVIEQLLDDVDTECEIPSKTDSKTKDPCHTETIVNSQEFSDERHDLNDTRNNDLKTLHGSPHFDSNLGFSQSDDTNFFFDKEKLNIFDSETSNTPHCDLDNLNTNHEEQQLTVQDVVRKSEADQRNVSVSHTVEQDISKIGTIKTLSKLEQTNEADAQLNKDTVSVDEIDTLVTVNTNKLDCSDSPLDCFNFLNIKNSDDILNEYDSLNENVGNLKVIPSEDANESVKANQKEETDIKLPLISSSENTFSQNRDSSNINSSSISQLQYQYDCNRGNSKCLHNQFSQFGRGKNVKVLEELNNKDHILLDAHYPLNSPSNEDGGLIFADLNEEIQDSEEPKAITKIELVSSNNNSVNLVLENQEPDKEDLIGDVLLNLCVKSNIDFSASEITDLPCNLEIAENLLDKNNPYSEPSIISLLNTQTESVVDKVNPILQEQNKIKMDCEETIKTVMELPENSTSFLKIESPQNFDGTNTDDIADPEKLLFMLLDAEEKNQFVSKDSINGSDIVADDKSIEMAHTFSSPQDTSEIETDGLNTIDNELQFIQNIETLSDDSSEHSIYGRANTPVDEGSLKATNEILDIFLKHIEDQADNELQEEVAEDALLFNQNVDVQLPDELLFFNEQTLEIIPEMEEPLESNDDESTSSSEIEFEYHQNPEDKKPEIQLSSYHAEKELSDPLNETNQKSEEKHLDNSCQKDFNGTLQKDLLNNRITESNELNQMPKSDSVSSGLSTLYEIEDIDEILVEDECEDKYRPDNETSEDFLLVNVNCENVEILNNMTKEEFNFASSGNQTENQQSTDVSEDNLHAQKFIDDISEGETISSLADAFNKSVHQIARRMSEVEMELVSDSDKNDQDPTVCIADAVETPVMDYEISPSKDSPDLVNFSTSQSESSTNLYIETFDQSDNIMLDNVNSNFLEYIGNPEPYIITGNNEQFVITNNNGDSFCDNRLVQMTDQNLNANEILNSPNLQNQYNFVHEKDRKNIQNIENVGNVIEEFGVKTLIETKRPNPIIVNAAQVSPFTCVAYSESYKNKEDLHADGHTKYLRNLDADKVNVFNLQNLQEEKYITPILEKNSSDTNNDVSKLLKDEKDSHFNSDLSISENASISGEDDVPKEGCVIIEDLDSPQSGKSIQVIAATSQNYDEDLLIVDVETHKALLYETDRPRTQLAFIHQDNSSQIIESLNSSSESDDREMWDSNQKLSLSKLPQPWYSNSVVTSSKNAKSEKEIKAVNMEVNAARKTPDEETTEWSSGSDMKVEDLLPSSASVDISFISGLKVNNEQIYKSELHDTLKEQGTEIVNSANDVRIASSNLEKSNLETKMDDSSSVKLSKSGEEISFYKDPEFLVNLTTVSSVPITEGIPSNDENHQLCSAVFLDTPPSTPLHNDELVKPYKIEVEENLFPNSVEMLDDEKNVLSNQISTSDVILVSFKAIDAAAVDSQDSLTVLKSDSVDSSISTPEKQKLTEESIELTGEKPSNNSSTPEPCYTPDWDSDSESSSVLSSSSTSGEFDCNKPLPKVIPEPPMKEILEREEKEEEESDQEGDDPTESFKISTWDKDATPTRSSLRSPEKKLDQKKSVSFKKQKTHCIYQYPKEEQEWETEPSRQPWSSDIYSPDIDYTSYADWDLADEDIIEEIVEVEDFDINQSFENPPVFHLQENTLYKLSNIGDEDYMDSGTGDGVQFYSGGSGALSFQELLEQYGSNPFYNPENDGEDFWATTSFNSSEFFVRGSEDPFEVSSQDMNSASTLPEWSIEQEPYPADFHLANQNTVDEENVLQSNRVGLNKNSLYRYYDPNTGVNMFVGDVDEDLEALARSGYFNRDNEAEASNNVTHSNLIDALSLENNLSASNSFISIKKDGDFGKETAGTVASLQEQSTSLQLLPYNVNESLSFVLSQLNDNKNEAKVKNESDNLEEITFFNNIEDENPEAVSKDQSKL